MLPPSQLRDLKVLHTYQEMTSMLSLIFNTQFVNESELYDSLKRIADWYREKSVIILFTRKTLTSKTFQKLVSQCLRKNINFISIIDPSLSSNVIHNHFQSLSPRGHKVLSDRIAEAIIVYPHKSNQILSQVVRRVKYSNLPSIASPESNKSSPRSVNGRNLKINSCLNICSFRSTTKPSNTLLFHERTVPQNEIVIPTIQINEQTPQASHETTPCSSRLRVAWSPYTPDIQPIPKKPSDRCKAQEISTQPTLKWNSATTETDSEGTKGDYTQSSSPHAESRDSNDVDADEGVEESCGTNENKVGACCLDVGKSSRRNSEVLLLNAFHKSPFYKRMTDDTTSKSPETFNSSLGYLDNRRTSFIPFENDNFISKIYAVCKTPIINCPKEPRYIQFPSDLNDMRKASLFDLRSPSTDSEEYDFRVKEKVLDSPFSPAQEKLPDSPFSTPNSFTYKYHSPLPAFPSESIFPTSYFPSDELDPARDSALVDPVQQARRRSSTLVFST